MKMLNLSKIHALFEAISAAQALYIPSDDASGQAKYARYEAGMEMTKALNTVRSAKDFFFPQTETLVEFKTSGKQIEIIDPRKDQEDFVVFGVRACDARSFEILDKVFLVDPIDTYYKNRRMHGTIMTMACRNPEETCFCTTFGIHPAVPGGDVSCWMDDENLYLEANTEKGEKLMASLEGILSEGDASKVEEQKASIQAIVEKLPLAKLDLTGLGGENLNKLFDSEKWKDLSEACIACGTCTFVCPTCQCYDIRDYNTGDGVTRFRCWDSCMYSDFTLMAHGNSRNSQVERFRQRFMHKLVYFPANNEGTYGCVGCGRCLAKCPVSMNIVKVAKEIVKEVR